MKANELREQSPEELNKKLRDIYSVDLTSIELDDDRIDE